MQLAHEYRDEVCTPAYQSRCWILFGLFIQYVNVIPFCSSLANTENIYDFPAVREPNVPIIIARPPFLWLRDKMTYTAERNKSFMWRIHNPLFWVKWSDTLRGVWYGDETFLVKAKGLSDDLFVFSADSFELTVQNGYLYTSSPIYSIKHTIAAELATSYQRHNPFYNHRPGYGLRPPSIGSLVLLGLLWLRIRPKLFIWRKLQRLENVNCLYYPSQ